MDTDPQPAVELGQAPEHQLADPGLAAQLLGASADSLLAGRSSGPPVGARRHAARRPFESLADQSLRVYAAHNEARVGHLRTARGRHEIDLIVERADERSWP